MAFLFFSKIPKLFFYQDRHMSHSCGIMDKNTIGGVAVWTILLIKTNQEC